MTGVFINYRTGDASYAVDLIDQRLCREFGAGQIFRDRRSMRPGTDFPPELSRQLKRSNVLLALIGPNWLTISDSSGARRLDNPKDYVRMEIRRALKRSIEVIPVLLAGAPLPKADQLPGDIAALHRRQSFELRDHSSDQDLAQLVEVLVEHVPSPPRTSSPASNGRHSSVNIRAKRLDIEGPITGGDSFGR
ncbi:TIR domain-containing protein [Micromonospora sp. NPDC049049]|uniref:toll/interleukin-1 receptor domain-containing protein n=1 Tax=Micromonospora sp. NPDC049049 TaxID=3155495 RepID=UPI0033E4B650